jgi:hypothetical protein
MWPINKLREPCRDTIFRTWSFGTSGKSTTGNENRKKCFHRTKLFVRASEGGISADN